MAGGKIRFRFCLLGHWCSRKNLTYAAGLVAWSFYIVMDTTLKHFA
jgi:hypothetical protein